MKIHQSGLRKRQTFGKIPEIQEIPDLIKVQKGSFKWLLEKGLTQAFSDISPILDFKGTLAVELGEYEFGEIKYSVEECKEKDMTYSAPLFVMIRFINKETGEIKEQQVFMGDFPLMTSKGTFVVNGTERVIVSQLVRSPGVYFDQEVDKTSDRLIYTAKIIPSRGAWLEMEINKKNIIKYSVEVIKI